jgi:hypothetical protein
MCWLVNKSQRFKVFESSLKSLCKLWISSYSNIWHYKQLQDKRHKLKVAALQPLTNRTCTSISV